MALKIHLRTLRSYIMLICEYELCILPNKKVSAAKDHSKNYIRHRPSLVCHLLHNGLLVSSKCEYEYASYHIDSDYNKNPLKRNSVLEISLFCFLYKGAITKNSLKTFLN